VTFSKKAQAAGYYFGDPHLRPNKPFRQFNTWMGDPTRALLFRAIVGEIDRLDLVRHTAEVGAYLFAKLETLRDRFPGEMMIRRAGTRYLRGRRRWGLILAGVGRRR
jgi:4-aminobutyrate aminotransferase/(S)-3-amino-2-methylpropionate transaminase